jgi:PhzF family phenazine biosynthesis protein
MRTPIFQIDAFAKRRFQGNPAAVMPMERFPDDAVMQAVAAENNLAETAFLVPQGRDYLIRWFTPEVEVPLCGHATLASAAVVLDHLEPARDEVVFHSASGPLAVKRAGNGFAMDFPARLSEKLATPAELTTALGVEPLEVYSAGDMCMAVLKDANAVRGLRPDFAALAVLEQPGVIVTAAGDGGYDFVSRFFAPAKGVAEDAVTGSAHCMMAPYWAERLGKDELRGFQASKRGGEVICRLAGDRVQLEGTCVVYMLGEVVI